MQNVKSFWICQYLGRKGESPITEITFMRVSQARHLTPLHHMVLLCNALNTEKKDRWQSKSRRGHQPSENKTRWSLSSGDEYKGQNTATDVVTLRDVYRADPNTVLLRADIGFMPCNIFFPLLFFSLSVLFWIHFPVWPQHYCDFFPLGIGFLLFLAATYLSFLF